MVRQAGLTVMTKFFPIYEPKLYIYTVIYSSFIIPLCKYDVSSSYVEFFSYIKLQ